MLNIFFCILLGIHEIKNPSIYPSIVYNYCLYNIFFQLHSVAGDPSGIDYVQMRLISEKYEHRNQ